MISDISVQIQTLKATVIAQAMIDMHRVIRVVKRLIRCNR